MTKPEVQRKIKLILKHENINKPVNAGAKQGLEKALEILELNQRDLSGLEELETVQARAIAKFAIDFNNMTDDGKFFIKLGEVIEGKREKNKNRMKTTDHFKTTIKAYLDKRAEEDTLFAVSYAKEGKSIDECCTYIINQVKSSGCAGYHDDEIHSMAVHYYDEDKLKVGKPISGKVVVNHTIVLTEEEKEQARKDAIQKVQDEVYAAYTKKAAKPKKKVEVVESPSLFD